MILDTMLKRLNFFVEVALTEARRYKEKVRYWITFNEINSAFMPFGGYLSLGIVNDGTVYFEKQVDVPQLRMQGLHHQLVASAKAVRLCPLVCPCRAITILPLSAKN